MASRKKKVRFNASTMYPLVVQYEQSDLTLKQFCKKHRFSISTFSYWLSKYRRSEQVANKEESLAPHFDQLTVTDLASSTFSSSVIRITYPSGVKLELPVS
jgi:transposase-like protein